VGFNDLDSCSSVYPITPLDISCRSDSPIASLSGTTLATNSAYIDIATNSAIAIGFHNFFLTFGLVAFIVVSYIGFKFGSWLYRR